MTTTSEAGRLASDSAEPNGGLFQGRSAGVLAADLVGYSDLVSRNMHDAVSLLRRTRRVLIGALQKHNAGDVQTPGDFVLAVFDDPADLLPAAFEAQEHLFEYHKGRDDFGAGHWKIGLALGEVHKIEGDLYGNAINVAARLQGFAGPGEIWFTEEVRKHSSVPPKATTNSVGSPALKNIKNRVGVYRALIPGYSARLKPTKSPALAPEHLEERTRKPIIEIKPFKKLGDARSDFVADALTEEIGLVLSRLSGSITMTLDYGKSVPDYVLRGTVQREDTHVRITAQLISSANGTTIWAERFRGGIGKSFDFQDQIARDIVSALQLVLTEGEQAQLWRHATASGEAWEAFQQGHDYARRYTREGHWRAKKSYLLALSLDPDYLSAMVALGFCHLDELRLGWSTDPARCLAEASDLAGRATVIAERHPDVLALNAYVRFFENEHALSLNLINQAVAEAPHSSEIIAYKGALHDLMGQFEEAVAAYRSAISKSVFSPAWIAANLALTLLAMECSVEAEQVFNKVLSNHPEYARAWIGLTVAYVRQGRLDEAQECAKKVRTLDPKFSVDEWASAKPFSEARVLESFKSDLFAAGLP